MRDALIAVEMSSDWLLSFRMRWQVTHAAVVRDVHEVAGGSLAFKGGPYGVYKPCSIGTADDRAAGSWRAPTLGLGRCETRLSPLRWSLEMASLDGL